MAKKIGLQILNDQLNQIVGDVLSGEQTYIIEKDGSPAAVLLSIHEYERLQTIINEPELKTARVMSPRLANPAQAIDFELDIAPEDTSHA